MKPCVLLTPHESLRDRGLTGQSHAGYFGLRQSYGKVNIVQFTVHLVDIKWMLSKASSKEIVLL